MRRLYLVQRGNREQCYSAPELDFLPNSKSNSGIELELAWPSPGGIGIAIIGIGIAIIRIGVGIAFFRIEFGIAFIELKSDMRSLIYVSGLLQ